MSSTPSAKKNSFQSIGNLFSSFELTDKGGYISQEYQDFGMRLAHLLGDLPHKSLYIKMARDIDRGLLESALSFVTDAQADNKARLFMWKVKQLKQAVATATPKKN